ncbi:late embryogenesis abundant protein At1g64065-like [Diospyros lotus]|uniref:late embryogenesis abundant protein At1g64065-like n=1 Tax=Diospyros lotus TaxID=55363 RepID=UPI0022536AA3|nr:late embryogenesis abundant protein At1g64065-like [Diospyros lotus]
MAGKEQQGNGYHRRDEEVNPRPPPSTDEIRRKKRLRWLLYIVAFVIFQAGVIALFTMTVMKFRTPKFRLRSATFDAVDFQTSGNPSFNVSMNALLAVKNTNFGGYKFDETTVHFFYKNTEVGSAMVPKSKAKFRSTKKLKVEAELTVPASLARNSELAKDLNSGILPLRSQAKMEGKITLMFVFKKKRSTNLDCSMEINSKTKQLQNLICK